MIGFTQQTEWLFNLEWGCYIVGSNWLEKNYSYSSVLLQYFCLLKTNLIKLMNMQILLVS